MAEVRENGCIYPISSLNGYVTINKGRVMSRFTASATTGSGIKLLLPANGRRISAIIINPTKYQSTEIELWFGDIDPVGMSFNGLELVPGSTFQIDALFPWTGAVSIRSLADTGNTYAEAIEVSVP